MYLEIPKKLEGYTNDLKKQTKFINQKKQKIILIQIAKSESNDQIKSLYMIYNPFPMDLSINQNSFINSENLYKMYPSQFVVSPNTAHAFVAFIAHDEILQMDEKIFLIILKSSLNSRINRMRKLDMREKYQESLIFQINPKSIELSNTMKLDALLPQHKSKDLLSNDVSVKLEQLLEDKVNYILKLKFVNNSDLKNVEIKKIKMKLFDTKHKFFINLNQYFQIKPMSTKNMTIFIDKKELSEVIFEDLEIKISLI